MNKIFKARCVNLNIYNLGELFQINKLFPYDYSRINFSCFNYNSEKMIERSISDILNNQKWIEVKLSRIEVDYILPTDEFNLIWKIQSYS